MQLIYSEICLLYRFAQIFAIPTNDTPLTAIAYELETETIFTGSKNGLVQSFSIIKDLEKPQLQWRRGGYAITSLAIKTNENGEKVLCVSNGKLKHKVSLRFCCI